ncbi:MAG: sulfatase-like hydrolase/transferase, partial [Sphingobacterium sp.]
MLLFHSMKLFNNTIIIGLFSVALTVECYAQSVKDKPNVLLILVDDLKPAIHGYGDQTAITPHIDQLINNGVKFDRAYSNQAVCVA